MALWTMAKVASFSLRGTILANLVGIVLYQQNLELNMNLYGSTKYYSDINM